MLSMHPDLDGVWTDRTAVGTVGDRTGQHCVPVRKREAGKQADDLNSIAG